MEDKQSSAFIGEPIFVFYKKEPLHRKNPTCPDSFNWRGDQFKVQSLLSQWSDLARRGAKAKNMRPAHLIRAEKMGSWGVGRFFFRVRTESGRVFELYYDRTPRKNDAGDGQWILFREIL